jgi:hypothetical protein
MVDRPASLFSRRLNADLCDFFYKFVNPEDGEKISATFSSVWLVMPSRLKKIGHEKARKAFSEYKRNMGIHINSFFTELRFNMSL